MVMFLHKTSMSVMYPLYKTLEIKRTFAYSPTISILTLT